MIDSVQKAQAAVDPMKVTVFMAAQRAQLYKQKMDAANGLDKVNLTVMYGFELLKAGDTENAITQFQQVLTLVEPMQIPGKEQTVLEMKKLLALAYLRLGEQENCILNHTSASCIIPIAKAGQHSKKEGSTSAIDLYEEILKQSPDDLTSKYLLTIAAMTLGQYPEGIPKPMRIPGDFFKSKVDFPPFPDISNELGFTSRGIAGGIALEDFDNDGDLDIMTSEWGFHDQIRLFDNNGHGGFDDVTDRTGLIGVTGGLNINATDFNNDGFTDVFVMRAGWFRDQGKIPSSLLRNNGDGTFTDVTVQAGVYSKRPTNSSAWADFDLDGWLDLFVAHESIPQQGSAFTFPSQLYHNERDGTFKEVTQLAGLDVNSFVKGSVAGDVNNDGLPDLYLSILQNNNRLFLNTSDETGIHFKDISTTANIAEPFISFPTWMFDFNNDGWLDIFISAYSDGSEDLPGKMLRAYGKTDDPFRPRIYRNNHDLTFTEVSSEMGVVEPAFTMGCNYGDLDNDGFPDFYLSTGEPNLKSIVPNKMYWNREGKSFADVTYAGGFGNIQKGHAVGFADLDKDGDQDIYVVMGGSFEGDLYQDIFFENPIGNKNNWVVLKLEGVTANRMAIGARVDAEVEENGKPRHIHEMVTTGASFGGNSLQVEMGLGQAKEIKSLTVTWPSRKAAKQTFKNVTINQAYYLKEGGQLETMPYNTVPFEKKEHHHH
ncbi:MAG TPA: CRTAC1 family protein [Saprospiraceae bacterium]|nr:CRTAC1 family protein [Saprospiraceae bacterium]